MPKLSSSSALVEDERPVDDEFALGTYRFDHFAIDLFVPYKIKKRKLAAFNTRENIQESDRIEKGR